MLTRIEDETTYFAPCAKRVRLQLFGVSLYRSEQAVNGGPRRVWVLGLPIYQVLR